MQTIREVYPGTILEKFFGDKTFIPPVMGPSLRLSCAEAAGAEENAAGKPLVGGSGRIWDSLLSKAGIKRSTLSIINTLPFQPPDNLYPTDPAARIYCTAREADEIINFSYEHYVKPVLQARPWSRIDAIGNKSLKLLTGKTEGIMKWRGSPLPLVGEKQPRVIGILHPSYLMRDSAMIPATISDLIKGTQVPPQFYNLEPTLEDVREFAKSRTLVFDIETNGFTGQITMVGLCDPSKMYHVTVVPFRGAYVDALKFVFAETEYLVGQNCISFDIPVMEQAGIVFNPKAEVFDIMLMHHLMHPDEPHDLEFIASIYTQMVAWKHLASEDMAFYNACDVDATAQIYLQLRPLLARFKLMDLYQKVQVPLAKICKQMHDTGIRIDPNRIHVAREKLLVEFHELEAKLPEELKPYDKAIRIRKPAPAGTLGKSGKPIKFVHVAGTERVVPWQSPKKCEHWLYETLKLPPQIHPKTKKITSSKSALERLAKKFNMPELDALRKLRSLDELLTTFLKEDESARQPVTRIHSNFLVHGTATGRLSSSGPNLQNIPSKARYIYVPSFSDWCFVEADFSSLENRLAAWYANDSERLTRLSDPNFNEHRWLASKIYNIPESELTKEMWQYKNGKITNHGADGAMGPRKLALTHALPEKVARELILKWREINWKSAQWQETIGNQAVEKGVLTNAFSRKRWFWSKSGYTEGIRFLPQSTGADICFRTMIGLCYKSINWPEDLAREVCPILAPLPYPARLVLQVHDSLLLECPLAMREEVCDCIDKVAPQPWHELAGFSIPIDKKVGDVNESWGELHHI